MGVWVWVRVCGCVGVGTGVWVWVCGCECGCVSVGMGDPPPPFFFLSGGLLYFLSPTSVCVFFLSDPTRRQKSELETRAEMLSDQKYAPRART